MKKHLLHTNSGILFFEVVGVDIVVIKQAQRELKDAPREFIEDIYALFDDLSHGKLLGPPISKPLSSIFKGLHELRLSGRSGEFRVFI